MKKTVYLFLILIVIGSICLGCSKKINDTDDSDPNSNPNSNTNAVFQALVIDNKEGLLVSPDKDSNEYKSSDKMMVSTNNAKIMDVNNNEIKYEEIQVGDLIEITYNGMILESYPAQISASIIQVLD